MQSLLSSSILTGGNADDTASLASLFEPSDTADISSQGQLLSGLGSLLPADMQEKVSRLQTDLNSVDPTNLSDDDLKDFLTKLKTDLGSLPGALSGFDPDNMSSDDLQSARSTLAGMKSTVSALGQKGSILSYAGVSAAQQANLAAMMNEVGSMGSTAGSGVLGLLTSFNPLGDGSL